MKVVADAEDDPTIYPLDDLQIPELPEFFFSLLHSLVLVADAQDLKINGLMLCQIYWL